ncbi:MAG TPA: 23S rRNA (uracil(1939)-C(5))-methyltransferase RlmD [Candidatus Eisenbergiella intestinigallinarum]|uniref:23S rRNA (Uracil(1939)-C(5))-methyltransferase RlmD n=1 Tax=Candidatus Eisenbergiella intestinigallinarum TaxID=2838549 RepID=A0A9D2QGY8_9FIRM|nr:23S rRNA (uracil(1939)-C(5))-methyltransferase RlmD [Candidatus Eisenbergiella intestinigallinarum]
MKKGEIREGIVEQVKFPNKGCVRLLPVVKEPPEESLRTAAEENVIPALGASSEAEEDKAEYATVKNVIPGQKLSVRITKVRKGKGEGRALKLLAPSPDEVAAPCPHFGSCGGCLYLSLPYEKQLALKEVQVRELLEEALSGQEAPWSFEPIKPSPRPYAYRNKMEFSFGDEVKDGPLSLGLHKRGGFYDIVAVTGCQIVDEDYRRILRETLSYFQKKEIPYFHRLSHVGYLRHLLVRKASLTGELLIALVTTSQMDAQKEETLLEGFAAMLENLALEGKIAGILHIRNDSVADVVKSDEARILRGKDFFYEELLGLRFRISVFSFFQTNSYGAQVLYQTARDYIGDLGKKDCVVYDLYSGTGTIAQMMAPAAGKVIGVEIVEEAVEAARENAKENGLSNCEFIAGDVLKVLDEIEEKPDFIILDPPRDGIHPKALQKIIRYGVERMIYISCKPTSLARDLEVLTASGYQVGRACCVDMFPWTGNVETVCLLRKTQD